jgi:hypothetical protein
MHRPISTRAHGFIDYAWASTAGTLPKMMEDATATARLVRSAGAAASVNSMVTNYEGGVLRMMPMRMHLAMDVLLGTALLLAPLFLPRSERRYAAVPVALGAVGLLTSMLTQRDAPAELTGEFTPSHELSEAVADPDVARWPPLRAHLE